MTNNPVKHTITISDKELFVIHSALQDFCYIDDSEYQKMVSIAEKLLKKIPEPAVKYDDLKS